jgi:hypothetical protein
VRPRSGPIIHRTSPGAHRPPREAGQRQRRCPRPTKVGRLAALLCVLVAAGGATATTATATGGGHATHHDQVLSNEKTFTRWAYVHRIAWIYGGPRVSALRVGQLIRSTPDGFPSIYLLLREHWDRHGQAWVKLRIPGRPNGRIGWVEGNALGPFHLNHLLVVVDRERLRMSFYRLGRKIWSAPVGVGRPSMPTPTGHFWIDERFDLTDPSSGYYPFALGTTDYSTLTDWPGGGVVGIHGPYYDPLGIPGYISHGCIRLRVADDFWLGRHVQLGAPLRVQ